MVGILLFLVIGLFAAMLFLNIYFRVKVMQAYKVLVRHRVDFQPIHIFNKRRMEEEIMPRYPELRTEIETFVNHIQYSTKMATVLVALITLFGGILMYFREV